jgi:hypothetical protein
MLATILPRCRVMMAMVLPGHAGDSATKVTWLWYNVDAETCWR